MCLNNALLFANISQRSTYFLSCFNTLWVERCRDLQAQGGLKRLPDGSVEMVTDREKPPHTSCLTQHMEMMLEKSGKNEEEL